MTDVDDPYGVRRRPSPPAGASAWGALPPPMPGTGLPHPFVSGPFRAAGTTRAATGLLPAADDDLPEVLEIRFRQPEPAATAATDHGVRVVGVPDDDPTLEDVGADDPVPAVAGGRLRFAGDPMASLRPTEDPMASLRPTEDPMASLRPTDDEDERPSPRRPLAGIAVAVLGLALVGVSGVAMLQGGSDDAAPPPSTSAAIEPPVVVPVPLPTGDAAESAGVAPVVVEPVPTTASAPSAPTTTPPITATPTTTPMAPTTAPTGSPATTPSTTRATTSTTATPTTNAGVGTAAWSPRPGWQRFTDPDGAFTVWTPTRMTAVTTRAGAVATYVAPTGSGSHAVVVAVDTGAPALDQARALLGTVTEEQVGSGTDGAVDLVVVREGRRVRAHLLLTGGRAFLLESTERAAAARVEEHEEFTASFSPT